MGASGSAFARRSESLCRDMKSSWNLQGGHQIRAEVKPGETYRRILKTNLPHALYMQVEGVYHAGGERGRSAFHLRNPSVHLKLMSSFETLWLKLRGMHEIHVGCFRDGGSSDLATFGKS